MNVLPTSDAAMWRLVGDAASTSPTQRAQNDGALVLHSIGDLTMIVRPTILESTDSWVTGIDPL